MAASANDLPRAAGPLGATCRVIDRACQTEGPTVLCLLRLPSRPLPAGGRRPWASAPRRLSHRAVRGIRHKGRETHCRDAPHRLELPASTRLQCTGTRPPFHTWPSDTHGMHPSRPPKSSVPGPACRPNSICSMRIGSMTLFRNPRMVIYKRLSQAGVAHPPSAARRTSSSRRCPRDCNSVQSESTERGIQGPTGSLSSDSAW